jgi:hypothetical protein
MTEVLIAKLRPTLKAIKKHWNSDIISVTLRLTLAAGLVARSIASRLADAILGYRFLRMVIGKERESSPEEFPYDRGILHSTEAMVCGCKNEG